VTTETDLAQHAYLHRKAAEVGGAWPAQLDAWHRAHGCTTGLAEAVVDVLASLVALTNRADLTEFQRTRLTAALHAVNDVGAATDEWPRYRHVFADPKRREQIDAIERRLRTLQMQA
jgi:hypothetical protein